MTELKKIYFFTNYSNSIGLGHFKRIQNLYLLLKKNLKEKLFFFKLLNNKKNYKKLNKIKNSIIVLDLPKNIFKKISVDYVANKIVLIDNFYNHKNSYTIYPTILKKKFTNKRIKHGKDWLLIDKKKILREKKIKKKIKYLSILLMGGSSIPNKQLIKFFKFFNKDNLTVVGPLVKKEKIRLLKKNGLNYLVNPRNIFNLIKNSKYVFTRYGVTVYEALALGKKPIVFLDKEKKIRKNEIFELKKRGIINIFDYKIKNFKRYDNFNNFIIPKSCKKIITFFRSL